MNLRTSYLGMKLRTPLVPSASPLSEGLDNIRRMEDAGAAALVLHSLFEEHISHESHQLHRHLTHGTESFAESLTYFPEPSDLAVGPKRYLNEIAAAKEAVAIPIIASLNGTTLSGWIDYAKQIEQAGADALELNDQRDAESEGRRFVGAMVTLSPQSRPVRARRESTSSRFGGTEAPGGGLSES